MTDVSAVIDLIAQRTSCHAFGDDAPSDAQLQALMPMVAQVANHMDLDCWRMVAIRGEQRAALGHAFNVADGVQSDAPSEKPLRAPLLIAIISRHQDHPKVPVWEQDAVAIGAAHFLNLGLWLQGWGSVWRTGRWIDTEPVRAFHKLEADEQLLGWLYVGNPVKVREEQAVPTNGVGAGLLTTLE